VYKTTVATVKLQIQQLENPRPAMVISVEAACLDNSILLVYLTSKLALRKPEIGGTDPNITLYNNYTDDELHFGMPRGSGNYEDEGDETEQFDAIPTGS
jgi:hypothetical protein